MKLAVSAMCLVALAATPSLACEFKSADGSTISFRGPGQHRYVVIDGKRCSFTEDTFKCGSHTTAYDGTSAAEAIIWKGIKYASTDHCSAGPE